MSLRKRKLVLDESHNVSQPPSKKKKPSPIDEGYDVNHGIHDGFETKTNGENGGVENSNNDLSRDCETLSETCKILLLKTKHNLQTLVAKL